MGRPSSVPNLRIMRRMVTYSARTLVRRLLLVTALLRAGNVCDV